MIRELMSMVAVFGSLAGVSHREPLKAATLPTHQTARTAPFQSEIEAFEAEDAKNPPAKGGIVFVGSSSIRLWKSLQRDFPGYNAINRGFGGSEISDSVRYAKRIVTPYKPRMIVFFAGTNDIASGKSAETVLADYKLFVGQVRSELPNTPILYISISPAPSRWSHIDEIKKANSLIQAYSASEPNLQFLDVFPLLLTKDGGPRPDLFVKDQLHMNAKGYAIWAKAVRPLLSKS